MARGYSSAASERTDKMRARAEALLAKASDIDTKDAIKAAKAEKAAKEKAEAESKAALTDPKKMADKIKVEVDSSGKVSFNLDGEKLEEYSMSGRNSNFSKGYFRGVFKELSPSLKDNFIVQLKDKGMSSKDAQKAVELIAAKASEALFGKIDIKEVLQDPANQAEITKAFQDLDAKVRRNSEARADARAYSSSPSDDGSYNIVGALAGEDLTNHVAYLNRLRDEISIIDGDLQWAEDGEVVNKQTADWMETLVYGGAMERAVKKHRDLFID